MVNYFTHDSNARNSDKLIPLRAKMGAEGYGIYFMLLERLREEPDYTSVKDYNMLAFDLRVDAAKVKAVVENFGLFAFTDDGKCFYSEGFSRRMQIKDAKSDTARESARAKWGDATTKVASRSERLAAARAKATHTQAEWEELRDYFGHCVICGRSGKDVKLVKDHVTPIYQGGSDGIDNLQPLCQSCNSRKGPDATDYRLVFCKSHGIEMPAKWLQNACKTPAIKEKESKEKKSKNNSLSLSLSRSKEEAAADAAAEKERILEIFYFDKNCVDYIGEAKRFFSHYEANGWCRSGSTVPIKDRLALARGWKPENTNERANPTALRWLRRVYDRIKEEAPECARGIIRGVKGMMLRDSVVSGGTAELLIVADDHTAAKNIGVALNKWPELRVTGWDVKYQIIG